MSRKNFFQDPQENEEVLGLDTTSSIGTVPPGFVREAKNMHPGLTGGWAKRDGYTEVLTTAWTGRSVTAGLEYRQAGGSTQTVLFGTTGGGTGGTVAYIDAGTNMANIVTTLDGDVRPSMIQFEDRIVYMDGSADAWQYDGTNTRDLGLAAPAAAATETSQSDVAGDNLVPGGDYVYFYTYYDNVNATESSPSASLSVDLTGTNDKVTLGLTADPSGDATHIKIYRTVASGNVAFLLTSIISSSTSTIDTAADSTLTTEMELDNSRLQDFSSTPNYPTITDNRIFCVTGDNQGRFSKIGQSGPMPESFEAKSFFRTDSPGGDNIVGLSIAGAVPLVLKTRSLGTLRRVGFPDFTSAVDNVGYMYEELVSGIEPVSHFGTVDVFGEAIILCRDNIYGTRGKAGDLRPLADSIQATIRALGFTSSQIEFVSAVHDTKYRRIYFQVFNTSGDATPDYTVVGDYKQYPDFRWSLYTPGTNTTTHPGIPAASFVPVTDTDGSQAIYIGNSQDDGQVYKMNDGTNDNTKAIYGRLVDRPRSAKWMYGDKLFKEVLIFVAGNGNDYDMTTKMLYDLTAEELDLTLTSLSSGGAAWDVAVWGVDEWAGSAISPQKYQMHRKAKQVQVIIEQTEADAPITVHVWYVTGSVFSPF